MAFDYKKEYKEFYMPKNTPGIINVPGMNYIAVRGQGNPNEEDGEYKRAIGLLYGIAFTIKMSKKSDRRIDGYFDYVIPPLEGFWWQDGMRGVDYSHKEFFKWISVIRLPDFVTKTDLDWAINEAAKKKKMQRRSMSMPSDARMSAQWRLSSSKGGILLLMGRRVTLAGYSDRKSVV